MERKGGQSEAMEGGREGGRERERKHGGRKKTAKLKGEII